MEIFNHQFCWTPPRILWNASLSHFSTITPRTFTHHMVSVDSKRPTPQSIGSTNRIYFYTHRVWHKNGPCPHAHMAPRCSRQGSGTNKCFAFGRVTKRCISCHCALQKHHGHDSRQRIYSKSVHCIRPVFNSHCGFCYTHPKKLQEAFAIF